MQGTCTISLLSSVIPVVHKNLFAATCVSAVKHGGRDLPTNVTEPAIRFCLSLQGDSVFADFDVDSDGRVFVVRVSFDGYGCCTAPTDVGRMDARDSAALLAMVERGSINATASKLLRVYFEQNRDALWSEALTHHGLT